jgi:hypothetical protein
MAERCAEAQTRVGANRRLLTQFQSELKALPIRPPAGAREPRDLFTTPQGSFEIK